MLVGIEASEGVYYTINITRNISVWRLPHYFVLAKRHNSRLLACYGHGQAEGVDLQDAPLRIQGVGWC